MASLKDCLGKIKMSGEARFWNEADHAALMKAAKKGDEAKAVKSFLDETQRQIDSITKAATEAKAKPADEANDPATAAMKADTDTVAMDLNADMQRLEGEIDRVEMENPDLAAALRKEAEFLREQIKAADEIRPMDRNAIAAAVECILNSPE